MRRGLASFDSHYSMAFLALQMLNHLFRRGSAVSWLERTKTEGVYQGKNFLNFFINTKVFPISRTLHTLFPLPGMTFSGSFYVWFLILQLLDEMLPPQRGNILFALYKEVLPPFLKFSISGPHSFPSLQP